MKVLVIGVGVDGLPAALSPHAPGIECTVFGAAGQHSRALRRHQLAP